MTGPPHSREAQQSNAICRFDGRCRAADHASVAVRRPRHRPEQSAALPITRLPQYSRSIRVGECGGELSCATRHVLITNTSPTSFRQRARTRSTCCKWPPPSLRNRVDPPASSNAPPRTTASLLIFPELSDRVRDDFDFGIEAADPIRTPAAGQRCSFTKRQASTVVRVSLAPRCGRTQLGKPPSIGQVSRPIQNDQGGVGARPLLASGSARPPTRALSRPRSEDPTEPWQHFEPQCFRRP